MAPQTYTLTFDSQDGTEVESQTVVEGQTRSRPAKPTKTDYVFVNWYLTGMETAFNFTTPATENLTVYAKWGLCGEWFVVKGNKCMPEWVELNWVIKISDWENEIWIRDRNVGATQPATMNKGQLLEDLLDHEMRMLAEQKWLRSWRSDNELVEYAIQKAKWIIWDDSINTLDDVYDYYYSYKRWEDEDYLAWFWNYYYRWNNDYVEFDQLFDSDWNVNLSEDFLNSWKFWDWETWWEDSSSNENPCDPSKWEYLPTPEDWKEVMDLWASITPDKQHEYSYYLNGSKWDYYFWENNWWWYEDWWAREFIRRDFMLPQAWYIYDGEYYNGISLWTSMNADGWVWYAWEWTLRYWYGEDAIDIWINLIASPIRCFVVVNRVTVTFDTNWWSKVESYNVSEWSIISAPATPTKAWYTLEWWYTDDGEKWDFENDTVEEDMTLYAKWRLCGEWFTVKGNKCVPNDMSMEWIIEVSDGVDTMYIRDRNVGAEISAWLDKASKINSLADWLCYSQDIAENADEISLQAAMLYDIYCPSEFYEQASQIIWYTVTTIDEINTFLDSYEYKKSFWNYYFWWNNNGVNYAELVIDEDSWEIANMPDLDPKFLEWWKLWNAEWNWWIEWQTQNNPCDPEKWEYLPTPEDWKNLMKIRWNVNEYELVDYLENDDEYPYYGYYFDIMDDDWWSKWYSDLLFPQWWYIYQSICWDEELCYRWGDWSSLWTSQDKEWNVGVFDDGWLWYTNYNIVRDDWWNWWNTASMPVRCFINVPDVLIITLESDGRVYNELNVVKWDKLWEPTAPSKSSATFDGWYTSDGERYDFNTPFTQDIVLYAHWTENKTSSSGYSGWGGSSSKPKEMHNAADDKEVKDTSKSDEKEESAQPSQWKTLDTNLTSKETFNAHQWAYSKWLTKYKNPSEARMDDPLNRSEMAKISSIFATEFLDKVPNEKKKELCSQYSDMWKVEDDMKFFITQACELWYMWYESNGVDTLDRFRPYTPVTVAEAATILSRIVWWNENAMNEKDWYKWHLYAAYNYGLIDNIKDPTTRSITRREAYLMLYRLMNFWE